MARRVSKKRVSIRRRRARPKRRVKVTSKTTKGFNGNGLSLLTINKGLGFPLRFRTKLRYVESLVFQPLTTGIMNTYAFACNDLYDPNHTATGHQPFYYDQLSLVYNSWKVIGSKINVTISPMGTAVLNPVKFTVFVDDDGTYNYSFTNLLEHGRLTNFLETGGHTKAISNRVTKKWSLKKQFKDKYMGQSVCGSQTVSPVTRQFFILAIQALNQTAEPQYHVTVVIDYIADFFNQNDLPSS